MKQCEICLKEIAGRNFRFCSSKCFSEYRKQKKEIICLECGKSFVGFMNARFCDYNCWRRNRNNSYMPKNFYCNAYGVCIDLSL